MSNSLNATTAQFLQLGAKFLQVLPLDASRTEVQKAIENENDPLWVSIANRFAEVKKEVVQKVSDLLKYLSTHSLQAVSEFVARDKFVENTDKGAELKISYLGENFKVWFLDKVEKNAGAVEVKVSKLLRDSNNKDIRAELGADREETALAHVYEFLKIVDKSGRHVFYVKDVNGELRAVGALWSDGGWRVYACSVEYVVVWNAGRQVVSR